MKKRFLSAAFLVSFWLFTPTQSQAQQLYFFLINNTGQSIARVYVSPSESDSWGYDLLGNGYLYQGYQIRIDIPASYGQTCYFDVKVVTYDGTVYKFTGFDMCDLYSLKVNWDNTYHTVWSN